jgi:hypothetical protein
MDNKYTAIIIEPRKHKALDFVLYNACFCLNNEWNILLFHGNSNFEYSSKIVEELNSLFENRIKMVNLNVDNLNSIEYSKLLATKSIIYDYIETEMFLVFQTDSMIFKENAHLIYDFLQYDYVGSPWRVTTYQPTLEGGFIGNGGFSLRNKNKMLEIIEKIDWNNLTELTDKLEDLYFSRKYDNIYVKKPEYSKACTFSVDEVFSEIAFACHKPWWHSHFEALKSIYPDCEILQNLQDVES